MQDVKISEKALLTIDEAVKMYNIGENTLRKVLKEHIELTLTVGRKILVNRRKFDKWIDSQVEI